MTLRELVAAVGGTPLGDFYDPDLTVTEVDTDSRNLHQGCLFLPLEGERFDAHSFISGALENGAAGCLTAREREKYLPGKFYIKVKNTQKAL
ncbi:MAG: Mur ligase domain-containing protein, partial [Oscillospiraceae bacterium]